VRQRRPEVNFEELYLSADRRKNDPPTGELTDNQAFQAPEFNVLSHGPWPIVELLLAMIPCENS
jgi:hypothetical protein